MTQASIFMERYSLILFSLFIGSFTLLSQTLLKNTPITSERIIYADQYVVSGTKIEFSVYSPGLENNLLGDSPDRKVSIYLPPGYESSPDNRYPVVYFLHGFTQDHDQWWGGGMLNTDFKSILDGLIAMNHVTPMIVVVPSSNNKYRGSCYTNSTVTGNWEDYIVHDLVPYVDSNFRTIPNAKSRGIAGHSMGGYGTIKLVMRNPNIFSAAYALSPAYLVLEDVVLGTMKDYLIQAVQSDSFTELSWQAQAAVAAAAAFAPNPVSLPYYGEFPVADNGILIDSVWQKWLTHDPYTMIPTYKDSLLSLRAIQFDCGKADFLLFDAIVRFSQALNDNGIEATGITATSYFFAHPIISSYVVPLYVDLKDAFTSLENGMLKSPKQEL